MTDVHPKHAAPMLRAGQREPARRGRRVSRAANADSGAKPVELPVLREFTARARIAAAPLHQVSQSCP